MMTYSLNDVCETCAAGAVTTVKDAVSVQKGLAQRRLEAPFVTLVSQSIFEHEATSSSTTAKPTPASGWRITASHAKRVQWTNLFMVQFLLIYLADSARAWLDHLLRNFMHPGYSWDLKGCHQNSGESLRDYMRRFSQKCHELPNVANVDVISVF
jgi:hypothetical protein